ncbi:MAG: LCP family protein [Propionibacteriaceae bacterium]|nr:LCP family protein [Propionibacteriaceae bacterium]
MAARIWTNKAPRAKRSAHGRLGFRDASLWTVLGTYLPGAGLIRAGLRPAGIAALAIFGIVVIGGIVLGIVSPPTLFRLSVNTLFLQIMVFAVPLATLAWASLIVTTHLRLRPRQLTRYERVVGSGLVAVLALTIAAPMSVAARYSFDQSRLLESIFRDGNSLFSGTAPNLDKRNPWKNKPRVNILLLGGDAGADRWGTRTDTVILASVDTRTGDTVLVSLPRNTARMPFPVDSPLHEYYPEGFTNGWGESLGFMLTEMYVNVPANVPPDILGRTDDLGADVVKLSVGEATGLKVDYYALVELEGFHKLIDALGGISVNINTWVPIGGDTSAGIKPTAALRPGANQHLNGTEALWYARGRYGSDDFERMDRQRCVIDAVIKQANPTNVLTRYEAIARQGKDIVRTDIPQELLPAFLDLALRVKEGESTSIVLRNGEDGFVSANPDFDRIRARVAAAINPPKAETPAPVTAPATQTEPGPDEPGEPAPPAPPADETEAAPDPAPLPPPEDLSDSCAYKPELAEAQPPVPPWEQ